MKCSQTYPGVVEPSSGYCSRCATRVVASGKSSSRIELEHCRKAMRSGDTLVVWRLDRLGRSLSDLVKIIGDQERDGITFESLGEKIDTGSASGKLQFHVFAALAEFERNLIRERTMAGLTAARARGRVGGRKPKLSEKQIREIKALLSDSAARVKDIAQRYGGVTGHALQAGGGCAASHKQLICDKVSPINTNWSAL